MGAHAQYLMCIAGGGLHAITCFVQLAAELTYWCFSSCSSEVPYLSLETQELALAALDLSCQIPCSVGEDSRPVGISVVVEDC